MTERSLKNFPVTWEELHRHSKALAWRLLEMGPWKGIVAVTRGGLVPAAIIARELDVRIVDDLVDTGHTARVVREMLPKAHFATVYAKPAGRPLVDTFVTEVSQDTWIYFPWDIEPQFIQPIAKQQRP